MSVDRTGIFSVEHWLETCPPARGEEQWKDGFSAKECAKAWFRKGRPATPSEVVSLLATAAPFAGIRIATAFPELATPLDEFRGNRRADVVALGVNGGQRCLVSIEAKAGEDFGPEIGPYLKRVISSTNVPDRVDALTQSVFGRPVVTYDGEIVQLRYQLLHALVGTVIEAEQRHADHAAFVVHYFPNDRRPMSESFADFQQFFRGVAHGGVEHTEVGRLFQVQLPGDGKRVPFGYRVWVGWATAGQ